jgi:hypothetical protein
MHNPATKASAQSNPDLVGTKDLRWNEQAVRIVEELFAQTPGEAWDDLLELRERLLEGADWTAVLQTFVRCRYRYEHWAYLPFYRLRTLLSAALTLENAGQWEGFPLPPLELLLRRKCRSLSDWTRQLEREWFEMGGDFTSRPVDLQIVELTN